MNIILSIKPKWAEKIYSGEKTIEWRKGEPKLARNNGATVYIYETAPVSKITGFFELSKDRFAAPTFHLVCYKKIESEEKLCSYDKKIIAKGCVPFNDLVKYQGKNQWVIGWQIHNLGKFPIPMKLEEFGLKRPPQSWQYIEEEKTPF